jgi:hypothetical protein
VRRLTNVVADPEMIEGWQNEDDTQYIFCLNGPKVPSPRMTISVNGLDVEMIIDSGAPKDLIDEDTFNRFSPKPVLRNDPMCAMAYQQTQQVKTLGIFDATIAANDRVSRSIVTVAAGSFGCLLGHPTAIALELYNTPQFQAKPSEHLNSIRNRFCELQSMFPTVFNDRIGKLKGFQAHIHVDKSVTPKQAKHRRPPYNLVAAIDRELDNLLKQRVIEPVDHPTNWVSAIVVVPKKKKPGEVRITLDSKLLNVAVENVPYVMPTTEEIAYELNGSTVFSQLDLNKAFHQIEVDEESRDLSTFITHRGFFRYTRLHMGIKPAAQILIHALQNKVISGLRGVRALADNILVFGKSAEEHDSRLLALCKRLKQAGLTVGEENCTLGVEELEFFGLRISAEGVAPGWDKLMNNIFFKKMLSFIPNQRMVN